MCGMAKHVYDGVTITVLGFPMIVDGRIGRCITDQCDLIMTYTKFFTGSLEPSYFHKCLARWSSMSHRG